MKIAVLGTRGFPNVQGGVERHCENLYPCLAKKGCDITIFARAPYVGKTERRYLGIRIVPIPCPKHKFLEAVYHTFLGLFAAKRIRPDILHIHAIGPSLWAPLARFMGMKVVMTHHGPDYERQKWGRAAKNILRFAERMGVRWSNAIISVSQSIGRHIQNKYQKESVFIPNGISASRIIHTSDNLRHYGVEPQKYILSVGRFVPEKGFHHLIDAFTYSGLPNYNLVLAGDADHEDAYSRNLKKKASLTPRVVLTGFIDQKQLSEFYSHAALFVLPSYYEGLPIVLLEALSYGLICLVSDIPAHRELQLDDDLYFNPGDDKTLSRKITAFLVREKNYGKREIQRRLILQKYKWEKIAEQTLRVYKTQMGEFSQH
jgi:glycosyltransferase involved in cell wall biosynthesis